MSIKTLAKTVVVSLAIVGMVGCESVKDTRAFSEAGSVAVQYAEEGRFEIIQKFNPFGKNGSDKDRGLEIRDKETGSCYLVMTTWSNLKGMTPTDCSK